MKGEGCRRRRMFRVRERREEQHDTVEGKVASREIVAQNRR